MSPSLAVDSARIEINSKTAAGYGLLTIIQNPYFDENRFNIQVKSIKCFQKFFGCRVKKHKQKRGSPCILNFEPWYQ